MECENKNRPEMHCNGKCFLAKKLKLADEQLQTKKEKQSHSLNKIKSIEKGQDWIDHQNPICIDPVVELCLVSASFIYYDPKGSGLNNSVFIPPCIT